MFKREVLGWNKGRRVVVLWLDVAERQLMPAKRRSTDLDVYPQFVFHTGSELSLSSASLAVSVLTVSVLCVPLSVCEGEFVHRSMSVRAVILH